MRKLLILLLCAVMLVGCGHKKQDDISDICYDNAIHVIETVDLFIDNETDLEETLESLYEIDLETDFSNTDYLLSLERDQDGNIIDKNVSIEMIIFDIKIQTSTLRFDSDDEYKLNTIEMVKTLRDELAELVNYK